MKVLHIISTVRPMGGPIQGVCQIGCVFRGNGHHIEVASLDAPGSQFVKQCPLPVYPLGPGLRDYGFTPRLTGWVRANAHKYDGVVINGIWQYHSFGSWLALRRERIPYVVFPHGMLNPWFRRRYPLKHLKKCLYWPWADYRVLRDAHAVLFTSQEERLLARESFSLYRCNEIVMPYGADSPGGDPMVQRDAFQQAFPSLKNRRVILFMGRLHPVKGCDLALEAFRRTVPSEQWHLVMAGPDQTGWAQKLKRHADKLGIANQVTFTGSLSGDLKWGAFRSAEVLLMPSHCENFGIVAAEALACGVPVLLSKQVNIWREIADDGAGIAGDDSLEGTTSTLARYFEIPQTDAALMRNAARACFERRFHIAHAANALREVIAQMAASRKSAGALPLAHTHQSA